MKVSELQDDELNHWVARGKELTLQQGEDGHWYYLPGHKLPPRRWHPIGYWSQGGPLIEQYHIDLNWDTEGGQEWSASIDPDILTQGKTVLEAAMRAYVILMFGEEVHGH